jgi:ferrous iron transport protein A
VIDNIYYIKNLLEAPVLVETIEDQLAKMQVGERAVVAAFQGGHGLVSRLTSLGFTPGVEVTMMQNYGHGPLIVLVRGARVALGRGEAQKITVRRQRD